MSRVYKKNSNLQMNIANWGIICHLPPFRGTRNNHKYGETKGIFFCSRKSMFNFQNKPGHPGEKRKNNRWILESWLVNQPPPNGNIPPPRNKSLIAGLIKGNQWVFISPDHEALLFHLISGGVVRGPVEGPLDPNQNPGNRCP